MYDVVASFIIFWPCYFNSDVNGPVRRQSLPLWRGRSFLREDAPHTPENIMALHLNLPAGVEGKDVWSLPSIPPVSGQSFPPRSILQVLCHLRPHHRTVPDRIKEGPRGQQQIHWVVHPGCGKMIHVMIQGPQDISPLW